jgi:predicted RNA binding protein YcfA (HicA-like mRNA interferase family)
MKIPRLTARKIISALKRAGFEVIRIKGSHHSNSPARHSRVYVHADKFENLRFKSCGKIAARIQRE